MKFKLIIALMLTVSPALAFAKPQTLSANPHVPSVRDRTPRAHLHLTKVRTTR